MRTKTLAELRTDVRSIADQPATGSGFLSDAEINSFINTGIAFLFNKLSLVHGQEYFEADPVTYTTVSGQTKYDLPPDFWQLNSVEMNDGGFRRALQPFMEKEHARWAQYPVPGGFTFQLRYIPNPPQLKNDTDSFDGLAGWERWVVLYAAIQCLAKEESDTGVLKGEQREVEQLIEAAAPNRDAGWPERIADVYRQTSPFVFGAGVPRYRLRGARGIDGHGQQLELLWGPIPNDWFGW